MARVPITVMGYRCERCGHEWVPRGETEQEPRLCPKCKSAYWNEPRKVKPMDYERFRDTLRDTLREHGPALTWTEIRTKAALPQLFPNNGWVRRMETDIGLLRAKDGRGIILWRLS